MKYFQPSHLRNLSAVLAKMGCDRGLVLLKNEPLLILLNVHDYKSLCALAAIGQQSSEYAHVIEKHQKFQEENK